MFGGENIGTNGEISPADFNGSNGFEVDSSLGTSFNSLGDINGDGFDDVIISQVNKSYVLFGKAGGFSNSVTQDNFNGRDGFVINGAGGQALSHGDINNDGLEDIIVGQSSFTVTDKLSTYVIYGDRNIGSTGSINTSNLDSSQGFAIEYGVTGTGSRTSLSAADLNGDGTDDVVISTPGQNGGATYVVYGTSATSSPTFGETFVGDSSNNNFVGTAGNDLIRGRKGNDVLEGQAGDDEIRGGGGNDIINGGDGKDAIAGGNGLDMIAGGAGADTFVYKNITNKGDTITDFEVGTDKIDVSAMFSGNNYQSNDVLSDYIQVVGSGSDTKVKVDILGDNDDNFKTLVTLANVSADQIKADSFMV